MPDLTFLIPISFFAMIGAIVALVVFNGTRRRRELQETLRTAIDKGVPLPADSIDAIVRSIRMPGSSVNDIRVGVIWLAVGVGFGLMGFMIGFEESDAFGPMLGIAAIPATIGVAYIVLSFLNPNKGKSGLN